MSIGRALIWRSVTCAAIWRSVTCAPHVQVRTLVAKLLGVVFSISSGLVAGKEGPFVHGGAIIGGGIGSLGSQCAPKPLPYPTPQPCMLWQPQAPLSVWWPARRGPSCTRAIISGGISSLGSQCILEPPTHLFRLCLQITRTPVVTQTWLTMGSRVYGTPHAGCLENAGGLGSSPNPPAPVNLVRPGWNTARACPQAGTWDTSCRLCDVAPALRRTLTDLTRGAVKAKVPRAAGGFFRSDADHRDFTAIGTAAGGQHSWAGRQGVRERASCSVRTAGRQPCEPARFRCHQRGRKCAQGLSSKHV